LSVEGGIEIFRGIYAKEVYTDDKTMVIYVYLTNDVPMHSHPHLQMGFVVKGKAKFHIGVEERIVAPGDYYIIPSGVKHAVDLIDGDLAVIDIFIPPREDYKEKFSEIRHSG